MISKECFTTEWIAQKSIELQYNDKNLIEKVIRALSLLELLSASGCPFYFKGGTSLMLILGGGSHRLSIDIDIMCPFVKLEGEPLKVAVPSVEDILGDKLTAFAPETTGIPYYKKERLTTLEIIKQLYDVGRLFDRMQDLDTVSQSFKSIANVELGYRNLEHDLSQIYNDIRQTALNISTRGFVDKEKFALLQKGIINIKPFMYKGAYRIEEAIVDAAKAAYLATLIETGGKTIERFTDTLLTDDMQIEPVLTNKLNKLRIGLPEAYFYWTKTSQLIK